MVTISDRVAQKLKEIVPELIYKYSEYAGFEYRDCLFCECSVKETYVNGKCHMPDIQHTEDCEGVALLKELEEQ